MAVSLQRTSVKFMEPEINAALATRTGFKIIKLEESSVGVEIELEVNSIQYEIKIYNGCSESEVEIISVRQKYRDLKTFDVISDAFAWVFCAAKIVEPVPAMPRGIPEYLIPSDKPATAEINRCIVKEINARTGVEIRYIKSGWCGEHEFEFVNSQKRVVLMDCCFGGVLVKGVGYFGDYTKGVAKMFDLGA